MPATLILRRSLHPVNRILKDLLARWVTFFLAVPALYQIRRCTRISGNCWFRDCIRCIQKNFLFQTSNGSGSDHIQGNVQANEPSHDQKLDQVIRVLEAISHKLSEPTCRYELHSEYAMTFQLRPSVLLSRTNSSRNAAQKEAQKHSKRKEKKKSSSKKLNKKNKGKKYLWSF